MELVVSDAHEGLVRAIDEAFPGAAWQECQTHFMRRALVWREMRTSQPSARTFG